MAVYKLPLVLEPQPDGGYVVTCPLVPELVTEGETVDAALHNAGDALAAVIEGLQAMGRLPLPAWNHPFRQPFPPRRRRSPCRP